MTVYITVIGGRCDIEQPDWSEGQSVVIDGLLGCGNILWDKRLSWGLLEGYPGCRVHGQAGTSCVVSTVMHPAMILKAMWHCLLTDCWTCIWNVACSASHPVHCKQPWAKLLTIEL